ncbi:DUF6583 family protein [Brevibacillus fulvus]|uniref:Uncharacterized protein n=1 Tax=Brevibacillus fulvus TaxID=1125967 RepID=A0A939BWB2_9BACL|nr:DUF6583 family protein [Brevibacillus fulvus]MBM7591631.1 hypothetical protein [Brevibacillus fulvus]
MENNVTLQPETPQKNKKKLWIVAGIIVVVILAALGTVLAKTDLFKSAKIIYLESELKTLTDLGDSLSESYADYEKEMQPYLDQPVHSTMEISDLAIDGDIPDPYVAQIFDLLATSKLQIDSSLDQTKQQQYAKVNLLLNSEPFIGFEYLMDQNKMGFAIPELSKKYGYIDLNDSDALKEKFGIENLPKRFVTYNDLVSAVKIDKSELSSIFKDYGLLYADSLTDEQVTLNKNSTFEQDGFQTPAREITVSFTDAQLQQLLTKFADKATNDEKLFDTLYTRYEKLTKLMIDSGYTEVAEISKEDAKAAFKENLEQFKQDLQGTDANGGLKMVLHIDDDNHILSRKLIRVEDGKENPLLEMASWQQNGEQNYRFSMLPTESNQGEVTVSYKAKEEGTDKKGTFAFLMKENGDLVDFSTDFTVKTESNKETGSYDYKLKINDNSGDDLALSGNISGSVTKGDKKRETEASIKVNLDQQDLELPHAFSLKLKETDEAVSEIKLPTLTEDNSINLATMTDEQMYALQEEVGLAAQQFMTKHAELFQQFMGTY